MSDYIDFNSKEFETRDFFLTTLEETCRVQLNDSEAKITRSTSQGRILLEVQQDELGNFFDCLPEHQDIEWSQEKTLLQREISGLKAQLHKAEAKRGHSPSRDMSLQSELEKMKVANNALQKELEEIKSMLRAERKMFAVAKTNTEVELEIERAQTKQLQGELSKTRAHLQKTKDEAKTHQAQLNQQRAETEKLKADMKKNAAFQESTQEYVSCCVSELEELRVDKSEMMANLNQANERLNSGHRFWRTDKLAHFAELEKSKRSHLAQLEMKDEEHKNNVADLKKKFEDQLASDRFFRQQEKTFLIEETVKTSSFFAAQLHKEKSSHLAELETSQRSCLAQLEMKDEEHKTIVADLNKKFEDQLASDRLRWLQEKTSLLKESEETSTSFAARLHEEKSSHLAELEKSQRSHLAQLQMQDDGHKAIVADLNNKFEDQLASDRLRWLQEKAFLLEESEETSTSFAAQLHQQKQSNNTLVAALETAEQQIESHRIECQESSLLQAKATESLQQTLQEKEREWTNTEISLRNQLANLESQIGQRRRRSRWYRMFLCT